MTADHNTWAVPGFENHAPVGMAFDPVAEPVVVRDPDGRRIRLNYVAEDPYPPETFPYLEDGTFTGTEPRMPGVSARVDSNDREACRSSWEEGQVYGIVSQIFRIDSDRNLLVSLSCETHWGCLDLSTACSAIGVALPVQPPIPG